MNYRLLAKYLGVFSLAIGLLMIPSVIWAIYFKEWQELVAFGESIVVSLVFGEVLFLLGRKRHRDYTNARRWGW